MEGNQIIVPSILKQMEELEINASAKERDLNVLQNKIKNLKANKPRVFGIKAWETELAGLEEVQSKIKNEAHDMRYNQRDTLAKKLNFFIKNSQNTDVGKLVKSQRRIEGTKEEIFRDLKIKINEMATKKVPENILRMNHEYKELQKILY